MPASARPPRFRQAIALDPNYALAYAGLAASETYLSDERGDLAMLRSAVAAADKAVALAPQLAEVYTTRGRIRFARLWDWPGAQADLDRALSLAPPSAMTHRLYGYLLSTRGKLPEAVQEMRKAVETDPMSFDDWWRLGLYLQASGDLGAARKSLQRAVEIAPQSSTANAYLGMLEVLDGHPAVALDRFRSISNDESSYRPFGIALAEQALGHKQESERALRELIAHGPGQSYQIAQVYAAGGQIDQAFEWLERAYSKHDGALMHVRIDPFMNDLRSDPRYKALLVKVKLDSDPASSVH